MGWEPITYCPECGEPHDVYTIGPCECCLEMLKIDAEQSQERYQAALEKAKDKSHEP